MAKQKKMIEENNSEIVVGLDIGTTKIAAIVGQKNMEGTIDILGFGTSVSDGVSHGSIDNLIKTVNAINIATSIASKHSHQAIESAYVGVAGRHIDSRKYEYEKIRKKGREELITQNEIDTIVAELENIPVDAGKKVIDVMPLYFSLEENGNPTTDPVGCLGDKIDGVYQIIIGNEFEISKIIRCVNDAAIKVNEIILEPIASSLVCLSQEEKKEGVLLVDIGGGTTDVAIYYGGNPVFTKVIPIGGEVISRDIATLCNISEEISEKLKVTYGTCIIDRSNKEHTITIPSSQQMSPIRISEPYLAEIIYCRVQKDILNNVKIALDESGYRQNVKNVVLTGGGALLRHIKELCHYTLKLPTRLGTPNIGFVNALPADLNNPKYSTALGLLKYGIEMQNSSNDTILEDDDETMEQERNLSSGYFFRKVTDFIKKEVIKFGEKTS